MTALDPAQTQYATVPLTLDLSPLTEPKSTAVPAIKPGKTVDITGTIYDTERYIKLFRMAALIVLALTLVFLLLSVIFRVAEMNIRRWLPKESVIRPFGPRKTATGPIQVKEADPVHDQFGYLQPAKLRYMDRTDRLPALGQEEGIAESVMPAPAVNTFTKPLPLTHTGSVSRREEGDITAVPIHKPRTRPVMMTSDNTMPFAPVHEGQILETETEAPLTDQPQSAAAEPAYIPPRVVETKPAPRIVPRKKLEIVRVSQS